MNRIFKNLSASLFVFFFILTGLCQAEDFTVLDDFISSKLTSNVNSTSESFNPVNLEKNSVILGDELLFTDKYSNLIYGKNIGAVVNQTSVNSMGKNLKDVLKECPYTNLVALYAPEHGIDGKAKAGDYVQSSIDASTGKTVYSLYQATREPTFEMLQGIDVLLFDLQDIGSRTYTYTSTMNKCMIACKKNDVKMVVLDRPNPVSCKYVEGFINTDEALSFVGIDNTPMAHGMTAGELAKFFNRKIGADLTVVPMKNYTRDMIWQDTGLKFVQTSPYIPTIESAFGYMATGMSDGTGLSMGDYFTWSGTEGINSLVFASKLNALNLQGVYFTPENKGKRGGVKLNVTDYHSFNPARTGYFIMATANSLKPLKFEFYTNKGKPTMFYKISGDKAFGEALLAKKSPFEIESMYKLDCEKFRLETQKYYIYK